MRNSLNMFGDVHNDLDLLHACIPFRAWKGYSTDCVPANVDTEYAVLVEDLLKRDEMADHSALKMDV